MEKGWLKRHNTRCGRAVCHTTSRMRATTGPDGDTASDPAARPEGGPLRSTRRTTMWIVIGTAAVAVHLFVIVVLVLKASRWVGGITAGVVVAAAFLATHIIGYRQVVARQRQQSVDRRIWIRR